jgi:hypothetical protein
VAARPPPSLEGGEGRERSGESPWDGARGKEERWQIQSCLPGKEEREEREKAVSAEPMQFWGRRRGGQLA